MQTRQQFIEAWRHELGGMVLDGATTGAHGAALSVLVRNILRKIDLVLGQAWDGLQPPKPAANGHPNGHANGAPQPPTRKVTP